MKRLALSLALVVAALLAGPVPAALADEPPFRLPLDRYPAIPYGLGMEFFIGPWRPADGGGGTKTFKADGMIVYDTPGLAPHSYRVLYEAENFVLMVTLKRYDTTWTAFEVIALRWTYRGGPPDPFDSELAQWYCVDPRIKKGDEAFHWPRERLLAEFSARCGKGVRPPGEVRPFRGSGRTDPYYGWNGPIRYERPGKW